MMSLFSVHIVLCAHCPDIGDEDYDAFVENSKFRVSSVIYWYLFKDEKQQECDAKICDEIDAVFEESWESVS